MILILFFCIITFIYFLVANFRHLLAFLPLFLITKVQKKNFKVVKNVSEFRQVLKHSNKGSVIEEKLATPAWRPIISLESVNGFLWLQLKTNYLKFVQNLPANEILTNLCKKELNYLILNKKLIDSRQISVSIAKIFFQWIFWEDRMILDKCLDPLVLEELYQSSLEFRKEIALKGKADWSKKIKPIKQLINFLNMSKHGTLFEDWSQPEKYSVVMQPFFISPMINFSDIGVSIKDSIKKCEYLSDKNFYEHCLFRQHPFPILERFDPDTNTQYFIDFRNLTSYEFNDVKSILFGSGERGCLGRAFAKIILENFFKKDILLENIELFKPENGHLYSGRTNDKFSFSEGMYQIKILAEILNENLFRN